MYILNDISQKCLLQQNIRSGYAPARGLENRTSHLKKICTGHVSFFFFIKPFYRRGFVFLFGLLLNGYFLYRLGNYGPETVDMCKSEDQIRIHILPYLVYFKTLFCLVSSVISFKFSSFIFSISLLFTL